MGSPGYLEPGTGSNKEEEASLETCANFCKTDQTCNSFEYDTTELARFGFWLRLLLTFSSPGRAICLPKASRQEIQMQTGGYSVSKTQRHTGHGWRVILVPMNVHPKRFLISDSGGFCTFQLNAFSRNRIVDLVKKNTDVSLDTKLSFCKDACLSMQEVAFTNALPYFLIYKLRVLPRGDRYPNRFNSIFEFRQKMIQFKTFSWKFNSNKYSIQYLTKKFNYKIIQFNSVQ